MSITSKSEAQANAEALHRRSAPYTDAQRASVRVQWDIRNREPQTLRDAVRAVRRAYSDEVPTKLHEGPDSIGEGGTPKMTPRAEGYLFGDPRADDAARDPETGERDLVGYHHAPFRARLADMEQGNLTDRKRAAIVRHVAIGSRNPADSAQAEGVPLWCAKVVAEDALRVFLRGLSDLRVHAPLENVVRVA